MGLIGPPYRSEHQRMKNLTACGCLAALLGTPGVAMATLFGGIDFPQGTSSFADQVIRYDPTYSGGTVPTSPDYNDPLQSLGPPDESGGIGAVALGDGGLLELLFVDNLLTNSGSNAFDLHVFEIGTAIESTLVSVRPTAATAALLGPVFDLNGDGFYEVGGISGGVASIDIDAFFTGFAAGALRFDAVQLVDDPNQGPSGSGDTVGADIDAVGAISSVKVPEPATALLMCSGLVGAFQRRRG